jgi:hypothetical protein
MGTKCAQARIAIAMLLLGLFSLCGCTRKNAILVLDEQWSVKQAEADCQSRSREGVPLCTVDPAAQIRNSEAQIADAFRSEPECSGITLVTLNVSDNPRRLNSMHTWRLFLELSRGGGVDAQRYMVERRFTVTNGRNPDDPHAGGLRGQGEAKLIAATSCEFVRGKIGLP